MSFWQVGASAITPKQKFRFVVIFGPDFYLPNVKTITKPSFEINTKEYKLYNHNFNYPGTVKWNPITITFMDMRGSDIGAANSVVSGVSTSGDEGLFERDIATTTTEKTLDTSDMMNQMLNNTGYNYPYKKSHILSRLQGDPTKNTARPITSPEKASTVANSFGTGLTGELNQSKYSLGDSIENKYNFGIRIIQFGPNQEIVEEWLLVNPIVKSMSFGELSYEDDDLVEYSMEIAYDWAEMKEVEKNLGKKVSVSSTQWQNYTRAKPDATTTEENAYMFGSAQQFQAAADEAGITTSGFDMALTADENAALDPLYNNPISIQQKANQEANSWRSEAAKEQLNPDQSTENPGKKPVGGEDAFDDPGPWTDDAV